MNDDFLESAIPHKDGLIPPRSFILVNIENLGLHWVDPNKLNLQPNSSPAILTPEQAHRLELLWQALKQHLTHAQSLEQWLQGFRLDQNPEREISVWEQIHKTYEIECQRREPTTPTLRALIYKAAFCCSVVGPDTDSLLSTNPDLKSLPKLTQLTNTFKNLYKPSDNP